MDECQKMLPFGKPIKLLWMEQKLWNVINCPDSAGRRGHGLDNQSLGNFDNFNSYGRNIFFATSKFFGRFCNEVPKVKYCHEFTKGDFSQSSFKEVTYSAVWSTEIVTRGGSPSQNAFNGSWKISRDQKISHFGSNILPFISYDDNWQSQLIISGFWEVSIINPFFAFSQYLIDLILDWPCSWKVVFNLKFLHWLVLQQLHQHQGRSVQE